LRFHRAGEKKNESQMRNELGLWFKLRGDLAAALTWYEKSVTLTEALGDKAGLAATLRKMGYIALDKNDLTRALELCMRRRDLYASMDLKKDVAREEEMMAEARRSFVYSFRRRHSLTKDAAEQVSAWMRENGLSTDEGETKFRNG
jgi:hypothetical protein